MKKTFLRLASWHNFSGFIITGFKVFCFYLLLLCLFRLVFIGWMREYMGSGVTIADIWLALWRGLRLSCQSAGGLTLVVMVPTAACNVLLPRLEQSVRRICNGSVLIVLSILFVARFPYYRQFHSGYNQLMFNTANDDVWALFLSLVHEFYLPLRLVVALGLAYLLYRLLNLFLTRLSVDITLPIETPRLLRYVLRSALCCSIYIWSLLVLFGGSLSWQTAVDWENAGVTRDAFLNEAILDDLQAIYRGYTMNHRMTACNGLDFTTERIRNLAAARAGRTADSNDLDVYLKRQAQGAQIAKPKHIFVIVSESYANWPLLDKYKDLHIADGMKALIGASDSDYCGSFLPNGASTVSAVTGIVTGFADANLYLTTMPEAFAAPYPTASAPQMERLGYKTKFWYAGPATWERVGAFTKAQGYDEFFSRGDYPSDTPGSLWGCDDEYLYREVLAGTAADEPSFNVVLNVSNHSPFLLDLAGKGFDEATVRAGLPAAAQADSDLVRQLGHFWYADREMAVFIKKIKERYPDSLIVVIGDHADRYNIDKTPSLYERYGIPFIITGQGVHKGLLLPDAAGTQIDVVPTIIELIAPRGFEYEAVGSSLTRDNRMGVNYGFWITHTSIGKTDTVPFEPESIDGMNRAIDEPALHNYIDTVRSISWWRPKYGPILDDAKLIGRE